MSDQYFYIVNKQSNQVAEWTSRQIVGRAQAPDNDAQLWRHADAALYTTSTPPDLQYYRLYTSKWLNGIKHHPPAGITIEHNSRLDITDYGIRVQAAGPPLVGKRLLRVPLPLGQTVDEDTKLTIQLKVGARFEMRDANDEGRGRLAVMISEQAPGDPDAECAAIGIELRDPRDYLELGPYRGIEATVLNGGHVDEDLEYVQFIPDERGDYKALEFLEDVDDYRNEAAEAAKFDRTKIPELFEITLKPHEAWGRCASAIEGGHTVSVAPYFRTLDPSRELYLDLFGFMEGNNFYMIEFIEVSIYHA